MWKQHTWPCEQVVDYNVPGGKLNRGLSVVDSLVLLRQHEGKAADEEEETLAAVLGWCIEWLQVSTVASTKLD
jgi:farnesyl diphosphate synthase